MTTNKARNWALLGVLGLSGILLAGGCGGFTVDTPRGFLKLERTRHPYKAVSAEGAVLAVRRFKNPPKGRAAFWTKVVQDELTQQRGYKLLEKKAFRSSAGARGTRYHFSGEHRGDRYIYQLALVVTDDYVFVIEATAPQKDFARYQKQVDAFFASFSPS